MTALSGFAKRWVSLRSTQPADYFIGANQELIMQYSHQALIGAVLLSVAIVVVYVWKHRRKKLLEPGE